jgi:hypothetical protein
MTGVRYFPAVPPFVLELIWIRLLNSGLLERSFLRRPDFFFSLAGHLYFLVGKLTAFDALSIV